MSSARLFLIRHAQAEGSDPADPSLSRHGQSQAGKLSERLGQFDPAAILHSPRRRAAETAQIIGEEYDDLPVRAFDLLDDRTPVPSPERRSEYPEKFWNWLAATPRHEQDVDGRQIARAAGELESMARTAPDRRPLVAITHAFVISRIVQLSLDAPTAAWITLVPANTGITIFDCTADGLELVAYNDTGHL